jgi:hypothetical protein
VGLLIIEIYGPHIEKLISGVLGECSFTMEKFALLLPEQVVKVLKDIGSQI